MNKTRKHKKIADRIRKKITKNRRKNSKVDQQIAKEAELKQSEQDISLSKILEY